MNLNKNSPAMAGLFLFVPPAGVEPASSGSKPDILSVELQRRNDTRHMEHDLQLVHRVTCIVCRVVVGRVGIEPTTVGLRGHCYYQLSYRPVCLQ